MATRSSTIDMITYVTQNHDGEPALNGDGHSIYDFDFYRKKVPIAFHREVQELSGIHDDAFMYNGTKGVVGIASGGFHSWVANKIKSVDAKFTFEYKIGRASQAQEIQLKVNQWLSRLAP